MVSNRKASNLVLTLATGGAKVLHRLPSRLAAAEQHCVLSRWGDHRELIKCQALAAGAGDAFAGALREAQRTDAEGGDAGHADIVEDVADNDGDGGLLALLEPDGLAAQADGDAAEGDGGAMAAALQQALVDEFVEAGVRALGEELVELDEQLDVRVGRVRVVAHHALLLLHTSEINAHVVVFLRGKSRA
ncbi:hypothetical protein LSM04_008021 [Trypanosoma melophagium]|uniref:uncharacterized protein n=1 Tax=Trypanosoma melophagium TaxID=715481 RepID=UPI00351A8E3B|nr:hypothetical protein LSM04_008021 [Trypanosoma melophagium]